MLFDAQLSIAEFGVAPVNDEHVQLALLLALPIPISGNQAMGVPLGVFRLGLGKEAALKHGQEIIDAANELPDPEKKSDLIVANNLTGVEQAVKAVEKFKSKK